MNHSRLTIEKVANGFIVQPDTRMGGTTLDQINVIAGFDAWSLAQLLRELFGLEGKPSAMTDQDGR